MHSYEVPDTIDEEIDELEALVERYAQGKLSVEELKAHRVPFGVYEQRRDGAYMVRIRCNAGVITPGQLLQVAETARKYGSPFLHVTTRQALQIHDVPLENVVAVIRQLRSASLVSRGGGGNTVRNIMASVDAGIAPDEIFDVTPYATELCSRLIAEPGSWGLPRKFKIAFGSREPDNANVRFSDLGFIAAVKGEQRGFKVYVAGGMGRKPEVAHRLHEFIPAENAYAVAKALIKVYSRHGNRRNKHSARLRFLWNKMGPEQFERLYREELRTVLGDPAAKLTLRREAASETGGRELPSTPAEPPQGFDQWKRRYVTPQRQEDRYSVLVPLFLGKVGCAPIVDLAGFLLPFGDDSVRLSMQQNIHLRHIPGAQLTAVYQALSGRVDLADKPAFYGNLIACAGADTCRLGISLSRGLATAIRQNLEASSLDLDALPDLRLNISGCTSTCGQHVCADVGFHGAVARTGSDLYPAYNIVAGAVRGGEKARLAQRMGDAPARDVPEFLRSFLEVYIQQAASFETSHDYFEARGQRDVDDALAGLKPVPSLAEDESYYTDWAADTRFSLAGKGPGECGAGLFDLIDYHLKTAKALRRNLPAGGSVEERHQSRYRMVLSTSTALLVTAGIEPKSADEALRAFRDSFIRTDLIGEQFEPVIDAALEHDMEKLADLAVLADSLVDEVEELYGSMDDTLAFPSKEPVGQAADALQERDVADTGETLRDYRGVPCPMNFVKTKLELANLQAGGLLRVLLDDGDPIANVPRSVLAEGHEVVEQTRVNEHWTVLIRKQ